MGGYSRRSGRQYERTITIRVKPTTYIRQGKVIHRRGYVYKRKDVGKPGKGPKLIPIKKGKLKKFGYSTKLPASERRAALRRAVEAYGALSVARMLQAQIILRKRTQRKVRKIFEEDLEWLRKTYKHDGYAS